MQILDGRFVYSASDLNNYLECEHLTELERQYARGERLRPARSETVEIIAQKGLTHERDYLERLRAEVGNVHEIANSHSSIEMLERAARETADAMERGVSVIYQGTFFDGQFLGKTDFLLRVPAPSARWNWSYEVADAKLALHDKPYFVVQLAHYSEHVARVQGTAPEYMHVVRGNGAQSAFRYRDFAAYYRHLKTSFLRDRGGAEHYPIPCRHCSICDWNETCEAQREKDDHLSLVAWMRRDNVTALEAAGISTVSALARANGNRPQGMREATYERLRRQAALQVRGRETGTHHYEFLAHHETEGFGQLPAPDAGDVFFDMEGDPLYEVGVGLEYLFGCYSPADERPFAAFWGTDRSAERAAFERCVDFLLERRARYPALHVYHYAPYEKTALRKLAQRHQTREAEVDFLLEREILVDLYAVVRQALLISQPSYSIKKLEPFYGLLRTAAVKKGDDSIVQFERWLQDPADSSLLETIERYNEEDCRSTWLLRDWLLARREEANASRETPASFRPLKTERLCHDTFLDGCKKCETRRRDENEERKTTGLARMLLTASEEPGSVLLGHLLAYHRREEKPAWWSYFDRIENVDRLLEFDSEALGGLVLRTDVAAFKAGERDRNVVYTYAFPDQTHQMRLGDHPHDPRTEKEAGEIIRIDDDAGLIQLKRGGSPEAAAMVIALIPRGPLSTTVQKDSLVRIATAFAAGELEGRNPVALDLLLRRYPRLRGRVPGATIQPRSVSPARVSDVVAALEGSYLFVQGPPGSGKTYTGARVIVELLGAGRRVGVMANGHKAIHNLLHEVETVAHAAGVFVRGVHKHSDGADSPYRSRLARPTVESVSQNDPAEGGDYNLISGTGWLFARSTMADRVDYLVIDEAGQTSLADAIAVAPSAKNIVLLGDPLQLAQVSQGVHRQGAGASILAHLLGDAATVPEDRGILLDTSYRMHPEICAFISESVYDGRLRAAESTAGNRVSSPGLTGSGLRYLPVDHRGNGRESPEEADCIVAEVARLLRGRYACNGETPTEMTERDILIVTPYNAQRTLIARRLREAGYEGVRVGTVDKFQGQEAPVVFYSMATSSGEDVPRNIEFLFEQNRFNVAVSRAQCLSVLVCSPRLLEIRCNSIVQMKLANLLCRYVELATVASSAAEPDQLPVP